MKHATTVAGAVLAVVAGGLVVGCEQAANGDGDRNGSGQKTTQEKLVGGTWVELSRTVDGSVINKRTEFTFEQAANGDGDHSKDDAGKAGRRHLGRIEPNRRWQRYQQENRVYVSLR